MYFQSLKDSLINHLSRINEASHAILTQVTSWLLWLSNILQTLVSPIRPSSLAVKTFSKTLWYQVGWGVISAVDISSIDHLSELYAGNVSYYSRLCKTLICFYSDIWQCTWFSQTISLDTLFLLKLWLVIKGTLASQTTNILRCFKYLI